MFVYGVTREFADLMHSGGLTLSQVKNGKDYSDYANFTFSDKNGRKVICKLREAIMLDGEGNEVEPPAMAGAALVEMSVFGAFSSGYVPPTFHCEHIDVRMPNGTTYEIRGKR